VSSIPPLSDIGVPASCSASATNGAQSYLSPDPASNAGGASIIVAKPIAATSSTRGGEPMAKGTGMRKEKKKPKKKK